LDAAVRDRRFSLFRAAWARPAGRWPIRPCAAREPACACGSRRGALVGSSHGRV